MLSGHLEAHRHSLCASRALIPQLLLAADRVVPIWGQMFQPLLSMLLLIFRPLGKVRQALLSMLVLRCRCCCSFDRRSSARRSAEPRSTNRSSGFITTCSSRVGASGQSCYEPRKISSGVNAGSSFVRSVQRSTRSWIAFQFPSDCDHHIPSANQPSAAPCVAGGWLRRCRSHRLECQRECFLERQHRTHGAFH